MNFESKIHRKIFKLYDTHKKEREKNHLFSSHNFFVLLKIHSTMDKKHQ